MKLVVMMIIFAFTILLTTFTESSEIDKNNILVENHSEDNLAQHTSKIQKRTVLKFFGLKPRYRPTQISLNWRQSNQQHFIKNSNNRLNPAIISTRTSSFLIQKNIIFYNVANTQHYHEIISSTTPKYFPTTGKVFENQPAMGLEETFSEPSVQQASETSYTSFSTEAISNTKTPQIYQITTSTTSKPQSEKPINVITTTEPTNNSNTKNIRGGFTSTSMPENNEYSELIYDIDPRYRKRSVKYNYN